MLGITQGKTLEHHKNALVYLDTVLGVDSDIKKYNYLNDNIVAMTQIVQKCFDILSINGFWVYNFPATPDYYVYNGQNHCFEITELKLDVDAYMLTVKDTGFDSRNYDSKIFDKFKKLYDESKQKTEAPVLESLQLHR